MARAYYPQSDTLLQSAVWGDFKAEFGWEARHFLLRIDSERPVPLLVLSRRLAPFGRLAYVPHGPPLGPKWYWCANLLAAIGERLRPLLPDNCLLIRFDLPWPLQDGASADRVAALPAMQGLVAAGVEVQPATTVLVDLRPDEEQRLAAMRAKTRYNIGVGDTAWGSGAAGCPYADGCGAGALVCPLSADCEARSDRDP